MLIINESLNTFTHLQNNIFCRIVKNRSAFFDNEDVCCRLPPYSILSYTKQKKIYISFLNFSRYYLKYISVIKHVNLSRIITPHNYDNFKNLLAKVRVTKLTSSRGPLISLEDRHCYFSSAGNHV
jgi:hypothetical protein